MRRVHISWTGEVFASFDNADRRYRAILDCLVENMRYAHLGGATGHLLDVSVREGDIDSSLTPDNVMRLIRKRIAGASSLVVLIGLNTKHRKFVDWEIAAALEEECAISGLVLPTVPTDECDDYFPLRFLDNCRSGYASRYMWDDVYRDPDRLFSALFTHHDHDEQHLRLIRNERPSLRRNQTRRTAPPDRVVEPPPVVDAPVPGGFAQRLRRLLRRSGTPLADIVKRTGVSEDLYTDLDKDENRKFDCPIGVLMTVAAHWNLSMLELLVPNHVQWPVVTIGFPELCARLHALFEEQACAAARLNESDWNLTYFRDNPSEEALLQYPVAFLLDVCRCLILDWRSVIPRLHSPLPSWRHDPGFLITRLDADREDWYPSAGREAWRIASGTAWNWNWVRR